MGIDGVKFRVESVEFRVESLEFRVYVQGSPLSTANHKTRVIQGDDRLKLF